MSRYDSDLHHRRSVRLPGHDYSQAGGYFLTICAAERLCFFGEILGDVMSLSDEGRIVKEEWQRTAEVQPNVVWDAFVVMPNHMHGILIITAPARGVSQYAPTTSNHILRSPSQTVGAIVRGFKAATTKRVNILWDTISVLVWQRNYYEHIVRHDDDLDRIRRYIANNPLRWALDRLHPDNMPTQP